MNDEEFKSDLPVTAGSSTVYVLSTDEELTSTPDDGHLIKFLFHTTNGVNPTLRVDRKLFDESVEGYSYIRGGIFPIRTVAETAMLAGTLVPGVPYFGRFSTSSLAWIVSLVLRELVSSIPRMLFEEFYAEVEKREVEENERRRSSAPRIPRLRSRYDLLCDEFGGPVDLGINVERSVLAKSCTAWPWPRIRPVLLQDRSDENSALKHWPWAAFAINQFDFETKERKKYLREPTPKEIEKLLSEIEGSARKLQSGLYSLHELSFRLGDPTSPLRRAHIAWIDAFISQEAAGLASNDVNTNGLHLLSVHESKLELLKRLGEVEKTAKVAREQHLDRKLLDRERTVDSPALLNFILLCSKIWTSLTGLKASPHRIEHEDRDDPKFVIFVTGVRLITE
jgi:hypothetical protein